MPEADTAKASNKQKHKKIPDPWKSIREISDGSIERLLHQAGVKTMSSAIYDKVRSLLFMDLEGAVIKIINLVQHDQRKTVMPKDVLGYFEMENVASRVYPTGYEDKLPKCKTYDQVRAKQRTKSAANRSHQNRKPRRQQALQKIKFYQKQYDCLIFSKRAFSCLVHEFHPYDGGTFRWAADAMGLLQIAMEARLRETFQDSLVASLHAKRIRIKPNDIALARHIKHKSFYDMYQN